MSNLDINFWYFFLIYVSYPVDDWWWKKQVKWTLCVILDMISLWIWKISVWLKFFYVDYVNSNVAIIDNDFNLIFRLKIDSLISNVTTHIIGY